MYAYLIDVSDSQFTQEYLNLLDAHKLFEDVSALSDVVIESDVCLSANLKQSLLDPKNHADRRNPGPGTPPNRPGL